MPNAFHLAKNMGCQLLAISLASAFVISPSDADDTDIYLSSAAQSNASFVMLALDYRQDLSGPYCKNNGNAANQCVNLLDTPTTFTFLQALDAMVNGVPNGASDGDADGDGLRDSAAQMTSFSASKLQALVAVARAVFQDLSGVQVGLMVPNKDGGGTILRGYREFQADDANGAKQQLIDILLNMPTPGPSQSHESQPKEMHYEWYSYINGRAIYYGDKTAANFNGTNVPAPDVSIRSGSNYRSPFTLAPQNYECSQFYEVYVTSGNETGSDSDLTNEIERNLSFSAAVSYEDMAAFFATGDVLPQTDGVQSLKTWFIHVDSSANGASPSNNVKAARWAEAAGTRDDFMSLSGGAESLVNIQRTLRNAFLHTLPTSATFVSSSIPTNVFNRANSLDDFFVALFEPSSTERWAGNVKKFKLVDTDNNGSYDNIRDANQLQAFDTVDGKIVASALSYWTQASALSAPNSDVGEVAERDGRSVQRGGAGQKIGGFINQDASLINSTNLRQLYVEANSGSQLDAFDATAATGAALQNLLGAATVQEAVDLIAWARGVDVDNEDNDSSVVDARPWLLGGVLHSRPLPINYGAVGGYTKDNPNIRIFFGSNDGFFHGVENTTVGGQESGKEVFGFMPRELLRNIAVLRANSGAQKLPYGMDGEPVALVRDENHDGNINNNDKVYVYSGMRRGGKSYYAFDVSNPQAAPALQWKITKTINGDFNELGYTFSTPVVGKVRYETTARDVLIFAGGFDLNKDDSAGSLARGPDAEGNAIFIVDAQTGALIWKVTGAPVPFSSNKVLHEPALTHSIPSAVTALDSNGNGIIDRLYVGDTGSVVWRVDLPEGSAANHRQDRWTITKLGNFWNASGSQDRRFFHPPDVVQTKDTLGKYDGVLIQTGDRANPTETRDSNYVFYIKDRNIVSGMPPVPPAPKTAAEGVFDMADLADTTSCVSSACTMLNYGNGWKMELTGRGEKGLSSPLIVNGNVFFTTYTPPVSVNSCSAPEGDGKLYIVDLKDGSASFGQGRDYTLGPGIPPSVTAIGLDTVIIPSKGVVNPFAAVATPTPVKPIQVGGQNVYVISWREFGDDLF